MTKEEQERFALEEIQNSKRIFKSATPKYTLDWYVKWAASILILISLAMRSAGPEYRIYDLAFGVVGIALWLCCLLYTSPSPRDGLLSRMPSSA